jgi:signal transduction histidine kinase/CheY-like chemotaxis protein/PAS domain-containing protein
VPAPSDEPSAADFIADNGELAGLIRAFDWSTTSMGPISSWPACLKTIVGFLVQSPVPMVLLWGADGVMIYNDAYAVFAGGRHPRALGNKVREGWPEIADFNDNVMKVGLAGGTLAYKDQELTLNRHGAPGQVWMNLDYSPVRDESGVPAGVMAIVVETTERVLADRHIAAQRARQRQLFSQMPGFVGVTAGSDHVYEYVNDGYLRISGRSDFVGHSVREMFPELEGQGFLELLDQVYRSGEPVVMRGMELRLEGSGVLQYIDFVYQPIRDEAGEVSGIFIGGYEVTEQRQVARRRDALIRLTDKIRDLEGMEEVAFAAAEVIGETLGVSRVGYGTIDHEAETLRVDRDWNAPGVESLAGVLQLRDYGSFIESLKRNEFISIADVEKDDRTAAAASALEGRSARSFVNVPVVEQGRLVAVLYVNHALARNWSAEDLAFIREIAERTRTAVERARARAALREANETLERRVEERTQDLAQAEQALRQSQKMEAVGQLTGGIAHDFNNMLAIVLGSLELATRRLKRGDASVQHYLDQAHEGATRAASLTQRLLAFSRQSPLVPRVTNLNTLVGSMSELLRRTLGERVELEAVLTGGVWPANVDRNQLESAIINLAVNARDAMPDGGKLTIEIANVHLDERYVAREIGVVPGQYVMISVTDTGAGMPPDIIERVFDPFFTTKVVGKGTGLGLSMVYGFAKQSGGHVRIYSEVGRGTSVKIYLPRHFGSVEEASTSVADCASTVATGTAEIVLVVEDDDQVRQVSVEVLRELGYVVHAAGGGEEALRLFDSLGHVDALFTDIVMPGMTGRQLCEALRQKAPALKVLYTTGYTRNAVVHNGVLDPGVAFLPKPFTAADLSAKLRAMLDA